METSPGATAQPVASPANMAALTPQGFSSLLVRFLNGLKRLGRSTHTLAAYRNDLGLFVEFLAETNKLPDDWNANLVQKWEEYLQTHGRKSQASVRRALMSIRSFCHYLVKENLIQSSPFLDTKSPRQPNHDLLVIPPEHFRNLFMCLKRRACLGDEKAVRDLALVLILGQCGVKASEAAAITWGDVLLDNLKKAGTIAIKNGAGRIIAFDNEAHFALETLQKLRIQLNLPVDLGSKLFFGYLNLTRKTRTTSLHRHGIKFIVYEVCTEILNIPYNSESLRNHAILNWLAQGIPAHQVADLAGYSSMNSLERFSLDTRGLRKPKRHLRESGGKK